MGCGRHTGTLNTCLPSCRSPVVVRGPRVGGPWTSCPSGWAGTLQLCHDRWAATSLALSLLTGDTGTVMPTMWERVVSGNKRKSYTVLSSHIKGIPCASSALDGPSLHPGPASWG